jgi:hypothetical protein
MRFFNRRHASDDTVVTAATPATNVPATELSKQQIKRATRTRKTWALITSFFLFVALVFLILVEISNIKNQKIINGWYFIRLDLSNIVPASVPNSALINTIAQTLGLHDFYQVGLWGFCEGYIGEGVTFCSKTQTLYWFNPVEILRNELLAGASSTLYSYIPPKAALTVHVSQSSRRHQRHPRPHPIRLSVDVWPLPHRHLPNLRPHLPDAHLCLHPLARAARRHLRLPERTDRNRRIRYCNCHVHHLPQHYYWRGTAEHWRGDWNHDLRLHVDRQRIHDLRMACADGAVLLLRVKERCQDGTEEGE